jgi:hypothetical protein
MWFSEKTDRYQKKNCKMSPAKKNAMNKINTTKLRFRQNFLSEIVLSLRISCLPSKVPTATLSTKHEILVPFLVSRTHWTIYSLVRFNGRQNEARLHEATLDLHTHAPFFPVCQ